MSYVLYSAIARAGGIDLLLGTESFARPHSDAVNRRPAQPYKAGLRQAPAFTGLRRIGGRALIGFGQTLTRWGRHWAPQGGIVAANTNLTFAAK